MKYMKLYLFLVFLFPLPFFLRGKLAFFLYFPLAFISFSLVAHISLSLLKTGLLQTQVRPRTSRLGL